MKKTISTLCALALMVPVSAFAQSHDDRNDRNENTHSQSTQKNNSKNTPTKQTNTKSNNNANNNKPAATPQKASNSGHKFAKGQRFERAKASNYRRVDYREHRQLSAPPRGYVWVRSGNDALLVRLSNNLIIQIVASIY
ncbi:RcnB family protein [uncultured Parasphingorhabdus sp.]|uniref:RcnB family protein n=1 Tax=uncultured Parasphingorhabdus sp. TaxID=2709694 RepID=UPI0030DA30DA|tara:strand:+ start:1779 stop:2195 length:417 start_codon:yes stop_codon:yes gene_type:complete